MVVRQNGQNRSDLLQGLYPSSRVCLGIGCGFAGDGRGQVFVPRLRCATKEHIRALAYDQSGTKMLPTLGRDKRRGNFMRLANGAATRQVIDG
jgi:hypothetical protein